MRAKMLTWRGCAALVTAIGLTMVGCGDSDENEPTTTDVPDATIEDVGDPDVTDHTDATDQPDSSEPEVEATESTDPPNPIGDGPSYKCLVTECDLAACMEVPECVAALDCAGDCETITCAEACVTASAPPFKGLVSKAAKCGAAASCFAGGSGLPSCGDDECDGLENTTNCPGDCSPIGKPDLAYACILDGCQAGQCVQYPECNAGLKCVSECGDLECTVDCIQALQGGQIRNFVFSMVLCGIEQQCLAPEAGPVCGNGTCEYGEGKISCPDDCGEPPPGFGCMLEHCNVGNCPNSNSCSKALLCVAACQDAACTLQCIDDGPHWVESFLFGVAECAADAGCIPKGAAPKPAECGDGTCDLTENPFDCFEDCKAGPDACGNGVCDIGETFEGCEADCKVDGGSCKFVCDTVVEDVACHCHFGCATLGTCCSDYEALCVPGESCGDESCGEGETANNCPVDCAGPGWGCLLSKCDAEGCAGANYCGVALVCVAQCDSEACTEACLEGQPEANLPYLSEIIACAGNKACFVPKAPECGDGDCAETETKEGCPKDCAGPTWTCLVDECEAGPCAESATCLAPLFCVSQCVDTDCATACIAEVPEDGKPFLEAMIACGATEGCLTEPPADPEPDPTDPPPDGGG